MTLLWTSSKLKRIFLCIFKLVLKAFWASFKNVLIIYDKNNFTIFSSWFLLHSLPFAMLELPTIMVPLLLHQLSRQSSKMSCVLMEICNKWAIIRRQSIRHIAPSRSMMYVSRIQDLLSHISQLLITLHLQFMVRFFHVLVDDWKLSKNHFSCSGLSTKLSSSSNLSPISTFISSFSSIISFSSFISLSSFISTRSSSIPFSTIISLCTSG